MTTVVRKRNWICSDSVFLRNIRNDQQARIHQRGKFFMLPERTAVVGVSGAISNRKDFEHVLEDIRTLLAKEYMNIDNELAEGFKDYVLQTSLEIMVATKTDTFFKDYVFKNGPSAKDNPCYGVWTHYMNGAPVILGSGSACIDTRELFDDTPVDKIIEKACVIDYFSGGNFYNFNLDDLVDYSEIINVSN